MKNDRRSLYRVLHVQPEAPAEIITAAYRCLMTKLRHHPDLGGDHDTAVRINAAYAVLSDPAKRSAYDQGRRQKRPADDAAAPTGASTGAEQRPRGATEHGCPFCGQRMPSLIAAHTRCGLCDSPLAPITSSFAGRHETGGRRGASRIRKDEVAIIYPAPDRRPAPAQLHDLSPSGISVYTGADISVGANVRITAPGFDLIAHVVQVRMCDRIQLVRGQVLTAQFAGQSAVFVSVRA